MNLLWNSKDRRRVALLAAPAFALALAACGGGESATSTDAAAPAAVEQTAETANTAEPASSAGDGASSSNGSQIPLLSPDEAIANAQVNQPTLQSAENVLDIETLAVADGSVQTLREVVDGDRPILLWFFSPH